MKRLLLAAALGALTLASSYAQNAAPAANGTEGAQAGRASVSDETSSQDGVLRLPDTESEVRSVVPSDVTSPLPPLPVLPPPVSPPPLPASGELAVPPSAYKLTGDPEEAGESARGETLVDAEIGGGLWSAVAAKLAIYRPGPVSYGIGFAHESADGFAFHDAGEGYSLRRSSVNGRADGSVAGGGAWSVSAAFSDEADGLQGRSSDFYAVSHRYLDGRGSYERPLGVFSLRTSFDAALASRSLESAASEPAGENGLRELGLSPKLGLDYRRGRLSISLDGRYGFRGLFIDSDFQDESAQSIRADLSAKFEKSPALVVAASLGAASSSSFVFVAPFSLSAEAGIGKVASLAVSGGLASDGASLAAAWRENPYLDAGDDLVDDARWFAKTRLELFAPKNLSFRLGADWATSLPGGGRLVPIAPAVDATRALYTYAVEEYETFTTTASMRRRFGGVSAADAGAVIGIGWAADWLDSPIVGEDRRLFVDLEYKGKDDAYGVQANATVGFSPNDFDSPVVGLGGFIRFSRSARFLLDLRDIGAAFEGSDGRLLYDPYLSAGFRADARIQISL